MKELSVDVPFLAEHSIFEEVIAMTRSARICLATIRLPFANPTGLKFANGLRL
jgi:hypothetical protein